MDYNEKLHYNLTFSFPVGGNGVPESRKRRMFKFNGWSDLKKSFLSKYFLILSFNEIIFAFVTFHLPLTSH